MSITMTARRPVAVRPDFKVNLAVMMQSLTKAENTGLLKNPTVLQNWKTAFAPHATNPLVTDNEIVRKYNLVMAIKAATTVVSDETVVRKMEYVVHEHVRGFDSKSGITHSGECLIQYLLHAGVESWKEGKKNKAKRQFTRAVTVYSEMYGGFEGTDFKDVPDGMMLEVVRDFVLSTAKVVEPGVATCDCRKPKCKHCDSTNLKKWGTRGVMQCQDCRRHTVIK